MNKDYGDNLLSTFGVESNPSTLVARAIHSLRQVDTDWAERELGWLIATFGDPTEGELVMYEDDTFQGICDALVERGWHLRDWGYKVQPVGDMLFDPEGDYRLQFGSFHAEARFTWHCKGADAEQAIREFEASGDWMVYRATRL